MKKVLIRCALVLVIVALICGLSSVFLILPYQISTDLALGQLENSNANFAMLQTWNQMRNIGFAIDGCAGLLGIGYCVYEFIKYFKNI